MNNRRAGLDLIKKNAIIALFMVDDFISHGFIPLFLWRTRSIHLHRDVRAMLIYVHFDLSYSLTLSLNCPTYRVLNLMQQKGILRVRRSSLFLSNVNIIILSRIYSAK